VQHSSHFRFLASLGGPVSRWCRQASWREVDQWQFDLSNRQRRRSTEWHIPIIRQISQVHIHVTHGFASMPCFNINVEIHHLTGRVRLYIVGIVFELHWSNINKNTYDTLRSKYLVSSAEEQVTGICVIIIVNLGCRILNLIQTISTTEILFQKHCTYRPIRVWSQLLVDGSTTLSQSSVTNLAALPINHIHNNQSRYKTYDTGRRACNHPMSKDNW